MKNSIDFYFDFSSPYGYFASCRIDQIAGRHGRSVVWRPYLMGAVFKVTGRGPLPEQPLVGDYARRDFLRSARLHSIPFQMPARLPISAVGPSRAYYWLQGQDAEKAKALARALYSAYFVGGRDISDPAQIAVVAESFGVEQAVLANALQDPAVKERLRQETDAAIARGVFGSPFVIVDDEPFWGNDRLDQVDRWLARGGW
ncbi:MAG: 2-hydroxychromene-2-carboxylate isomerase [Acidiferrobacterales bacterium]